MRRPPCPPTQGGLEAFQSPGSARPLSKAILSQAAQTVPFVPLGEYFTPLVSRDVVTDVLNTPLALFWNIKKAD